MERMTHKRANGIKTGYWLNGQYEPGIWSRTVDAGAQPREGGAPDE